VLEQKMLEQKGVRTKGVRTKDVRTKDFRTIGFRTKDVRTKRSIDQNCWNISLEQKLLGWKSVYQFLTFHIIVDNCSTIKTFLCHKNFVLTFVLNNVC
jgi:hypothetical protein